MTLPLSESLKIIHFNQTMKATYADFIAKYTLYSEIIPFVCCGGSQVTLAPSCTFCILI